MQSISFASTPIAPLGHSLPSATIPARPAYPYASSQPDIFFSGSGSKTKASDVITRKIKNVLLAALASIGVITGGSSLVLRCNTPPETSIASVRASSAGLTSTLCPTAYLLSNDQVVDPLFHAPKGFVHPDGEVTNLVGLRTGQGKPNGDFHVVRGIEMPFPKGHVDEHGRVYRTPNPIPIGLIEAEDSATPEQEAGLAQWALLEHESDS